MVLLGGKGSRNDRLTLNKVNISSGPKIPKGNFGPELIFNKQKVRRLRGEGSSKKVSKILTFFVLMARLTNGYEIQTFLLVMALIQIEGEGSREEAKQRNMSQISELFSF